MCVRVCVCVCVQRHWGAKGEVKRELYVASRVPVFMKTHLPAHPGVTHRNICGSL